MNKIEINIFGPAGSGKTTIALIIQEALEKKGFDVGLKCDSSEEFLSDDKAQEKRINKILSNTELIIKEHSIRRGVLRVDENSLVEYPHPIFKLTTSPDEKKTKGFDICFSNKRSLESIEYFLKTKNVTKARVLIEEEEE